MSARKILVFGLQGSGKTTFAAALWHLVDSREVPTLLSKGVHAGNFAYLEKIAQKWCDGWQVERTKSDEVEDIQINLQNPKTEASFSLEFTDLAGESFEKAFSTRLCEQALVDAVRDADAMLLFVSADRIIDDVTILDAFGDLPPDETQTGHEPVGEIAGAASTEVAETADQTPETASQAQLSDPDKPWDPEKAPIQIKLVDLLQSMGLAPFEKPHFRTAVIISAWDLAGENEPLDWFARKFPLLKQYITGPEGASSLQIYGVSAQGGVIPKKDEGVTASQDQLLSIIPASKRIQVVGGGVREHDLTAAIEWLGSAEKGV